MSMTDKKQQGSNKGALWVPLASLKANDDNPRTITDEKFQKLVQSIKDFPEMLELRPIVTDEHRTVLGGNMRLRACRELKLENVPIIIAAGLTEEQKREFIIKDNVGFGEWDWDELANNWNVTDLQDWGLDVPFEEPEPEVKDDNFVLPDEVHTDIQEGDLIQIGNHRIYCGDSTHPLAWVALMQGEEADLVVTDPPYNVNYGDKAEMLDENDGGSRNTSKILNDNMTDENFYTFLFEFYGRMLDNLKPGGAYYIFHSDSEGYNFRKALRDQGNYYRQTLIWVKNALVMGRQDYQWKHEPILYGWKEGAGHYFTQDRTNTTVILDERPDTGSMSKAQLLELVDRMLGPEVKTTILEHDKPMRNDLHPTMKPILLLAELIANSSKENQLVVDGFLGSGSTMVACEQLNRACYGIELDPKYCQVIIDRMLDLNPGLQVTITKGEPVDA